MTAASTTPFVITRAFQAPRGLLWHAQTQAVREGLQAGLSANFSKLEA
jgi:hypothetical protein